MREEGDYYVLHDPAMPRVPAEPGRGCFRVGAEHVHLFPSWEVDAAPPLTDPAHWVVPRVSIDRCFVHGFFIETEMWGGACPGCVTVH